MNWQKVLEASDRGVGLRVIVEKVIIDLKNCRKVEERKGLYEIRRKKAIIANRVDAAVEKGVVEMGCGLAVIWTTRSIKGIKEKWYIGITWRSKVDLVRE